MYYSELETRLIGRPEFRYDSLIERIISVYCATTPRVGYVRASIMSRAESKN